MSNHQPTIYDALGVTPPYKERHEDDFYETPALLTKELLNRVNICGSILEPCAGKSAITKVLKSYPYSNNQVLESDISYDRNHPTDATTKEFWQYWRSHFEKNYGNKGIEWVVTNPPFNQAHLILPLALEHCSFGVAFLLRSTYTEPCDNRSNWLIRNSDRHRYRFDINPRPQFRNDGKSDSASCSWLVWLKNWSWRELGMQSPFGYIKDWR